MNEIVRRDPEGDQCVSGSSVDSGLGKYTRRTEEFFSDEETINENGGKQSRTVYRLDLVDPFAILSLGRVLQRGVKYGKDNWRLIPAEDHVNHALGHIMGWLGGDKTDDHLANAFCRLMMAIAMEKPTDGI